MNDERDVFESPSITVTWSRARCTYVAECVRGLPAAFQPGRRPWVRPEAADLERVVEVVRRCPTGALQYTRHDGGPGERGPEANALVPVPHGPYLLRGEIEIARHEEDPVRDTRVALCRCGGSRNRPFCDGTHRENGFDDAGLLGEGGAPASDGETGGPLRVTPRPDGPLVIEGRFRLASVRGGASRDLERGVLCRCGGSRNKPFCDGSHQRVRHEEEGNVE